MTDQNLPSSLTSFVGRTGEVKTVMQLLVEHRLVTIAGPGGSGKTRLSLEVAAQLLPRYKDGVWLVELAPLADAHLVPQAVATVLGVREQPRQPIIDTLIKYASNRSYLIVLDNCEHLTTACADVATQLLTLCPNIRILVTSRQVLGVRGEVIWRIPPLSIPQPKAPLTTDELREFEATHLFLDRAASIMPGFDAGDQAASAIVEICRRLDGIPLAIELAAARIKVLSVDQILNRLDDRFGLLSVKERGALSSSRTLRGTLDWSYSLLTASEQTLWRRLAVFAGGFTLEAAELVCSGDGLPASEVLDLLAELVDKSMVFSDQTDSGPRFRMLETMRHYGQERLEEAGDEPTWRSRHVNWCLYLAEGVLSDVRTRKEALRRLAEESGNIRAALAWSKKVLDVERGLRLVTALNLYWEAMGYNTEGRDHLEQLLALPGASTHLALRVKALKTAGDLAANQSDFAEAIRLYEDSLAICREVDDQLGMAASYHGLAKVAAALNDWDRSESLSQQSLAICQALGDNRRASRLLLSLGNISKARGDYTQAQDRYYEYLLIGRELDDKRSVAFALGSLGLVAEQLGDGAEAVARHEECLDLLREVGDKGGISKTLMNLANALTMLGAYSQAEDLYRQSLSLHRELGDKLNTAGCLYNIGRVANKQVDYRRAMSMLQESAKLAQALDAKLLLAFLLEELAVVHHAKGRHTRSARLLGAADVTRRCAGSPLPPAHRDEHERLVTELRTVLGEDRWSAAWDEGQHMPLATAVDHARQDFSAAHESEELKIPATVAQNPVVLEGDGRIEQITKHKRHQYTVLTKREAEITRLVAQGLSDRKVAAQLVISSRTVDTHLRNIFGKVGVSSRAGLAAWAIRNGVADSQ